MKENAIKAAMAAALGALLAKIPPAWAPPIQYVGSVIGPTFDSIRGTLLVRLHDAALLGYTDEDVKAACRALSNPENRVTLTYPNDWLQAFDKFLVASRRQRKKEAADLAAAARRADDEPQAERGAHEAVAFRARLRRRDVGHIRIGGREARRRRGVEHTPDHQPGDVRRQRHD